VRRQLAAVGPLALAVLVVACGGTADEPGERTPGPTATAPETTDAAGSESSGSIDELDLRLAQVVEVEQPLAMAQRPGGTTLFVGSKTGRVDVVRDGSLAGDPVLDLRREVSGGSEQGLLGLAFSDDGSRLFVSYTDRRGDSRLDEFAVDEDDIVDTASRRTVLEVGQPATNHNGGHVVLGPDGYLWYGLGDGGGGGDRFGNAQDTDTVLGAILRIDPTAGDDRGYGIPDDNPFVDGGGRPEIAVFGVRNPWRFSFDRETGDLWVGDVGQGEIEEIDLLPAGRTLGANLGWPFLEGSRPYSGERPPADAVPPVFEYTRDEGRSVVGGVVYRGSAVPALRGVYLFADTYTARIRALTVDDGRVTSAVDLDLPVPGGMVASFAEDADGEVYVLSLGGGVFRLEGP
jgi:glucose/arabinose dehydrogenase